MGKYKYLLIMALLCHASMAWAGAGMTRTRFTDTVRDRVLDTHVWYPCETGEPERFAENPVFEGFDAVADGTVAPGRYPLYILLHGTTGNWRNLSWLAARLAAGGAIVAAADHPGYTSGNATPASVIRAWDQPMDASFLLGALLKSRFGEHIDARAVYAVGYSLGGYSALALAGARLDMHGYPAFCAEHDDASCRYFRPTFPGLDQAYYRHAAMDLGDARFTGLIAIAPGLLEVCTPQSLRGITVPVLVVGAAGDENVPPASHLLPATAHFSMSMRYEEIPDAAHFSFMQLCKPGGAAILAEDGEEFVCMDGGGDRREIHDRLFDLITHFVRDTAR